MNLSRGELHALRSERATLARCISEIRTVTALPDVPLAELPRMIETLLSELADRQIQADIKAEEACRG